MKDKLREECTHYTAPQWQTARLKNIILPVVKEIFNVKIGLFLFFWPGTSPIRRGAQFLAICPYRFDRSSHLEPIQAQKHVPS